MESKLDEKLVFNLILLVTRALAATHLQFVLRLSASSAIFVPNSLKNCNEKHSNIISLRKNVTRCPRLDGLMSSVLPIPYLIIVSERG